MAVRLSAAQNHAGCRRLRHPDETCAASLILCFLMSPTLQAWDAPAIGSWLKQQSAVIEPHTPQRCSEVSVSCRRDCRAPSRACSCSTAEHAACRSQAQAQAAAVPGAKQEQRCDEGPGACYIDLQPSPCYVSHPRSPQRCCSNACLCTAIRERRLHVWAGQATALGRPLWMAATTARTRHT